MKHPVKYGGILAKPIEVSLPAQPNPLFGQAAQEKWLQQVAAADLFIAEQRTLKWQALREHYGIDPECSWEDVAQLLASFHVPGLYVRKKVRSGPKLSWTATRVRELRKSADALVAGGLTFAKAFDLLADQPEWKPAAASSLRTRYYAGKTSTKLSPSK